MKKIKILLLGFLAVLMVGIVSLASAPITYADETEPMENYNTLVNLNELELTDHGYYSTFFLLPNLDAGIRVEATIMLKDYTYLDISFVLKNFEISNVTFIPDDWELKIMNEKDQSQVEIEEFYSVVMKYKDEQHPVTILRFVKDDVNFTSYGEQSFVKNEFSLNFSNRPRLYIKGNDGEIIDTGNRPGTVPPLVNEKGNISPVYLYSGLIIIALGIGAYVYTLGKNKKGKRK